MKKKFFISVIYQSTYKQAVMDTVTIPANNLFTDGKLNELGKQKVGNALCGLVDHSGTAEQVCIELEDSRYDKESKSQLKSKAQKLFVLCPEERLLLVIFKEITKYLINDINSMNASIEESLAEIKIENNKGDK